MPNHLFEGGATGLSLIVYYLFKVQPWVMNIVINIPLFIIGWKILGRKTLYLSILGTLSVTVWLALFEKVPFAIDLHEDLILVSILGDYSLDLVWVLFSALVGQPVVVILLHVLVTNTSLFYWPNYFRN